MENVKSENIRRKSVKFVKGQSGNPAGRPAGIPNKMTVQSREAIALFIEGNVHRLQEWLDEIAEESPIEAFELFMSVVEFHIPKLARTDTLSIVKRDKGELTPLPQYFTAEEAAAAYQEAIK